MNPKIIKQALLKFPRTQIWQALADSAQFGPWNCHIK